jgi:hypothetical protein
MGEMTFCDVIFLNQDTSGLFNTYLRFVEGLITAMKQTEDVAHILVMKCNARTVDDDTKTSISSRLTC